MKKSGESFEASIPAALQLAKTLTVISDQGPTMLSALSFLQGEKLLVHGSFDKYHRLIRDCKLSADPCKQPWQHSNCGGSNMAHLEAFWQRRRKLPWPTSCRPRLLLLDLLASKVFVSTDLLKCVKLSLSCWG